MTKILFLDIDGVLNRFRARAEFNRIDPQLAKRLNGLLLDTGAKIVVSSSWRYLIINHHFSCDGFAYLLKTHGVSAASVIGHTGESGESRGAEIRQWRKDHPLYRDAAYCILDDDTDGMNFHGDKFIRVESRHGLTDEAVERAVELLGRE